MATEITTQSAGGGPLATLLVGSDLPLAHPTDITLTARNAQISGYEKSGTDLTVRFVDGHALEVQNFFVIGEQGDFSRLIAASGAPLVTGLMGPEAPDEDPLKEQPLAEPSSPALPLPADVIEVFPNPALLETAASEATGSETEAAGSGGTASGGGTGGTASGSGSWSQPALLAGVGVASGLGLGGGGDNDTPPSAQSLTESAPVSDQDASDQEAGEDIEPDGSPEDEGANAEDAFEEVPETALLQLLGEEDSPYDIALILDPPAADPEDLPPEASQAEAMRPTPQENGAPQVESATQSEAQSEFQGESQEETAVSHRVPRSETGSEIAGDTSPDTGLSFMDPHSSDLPAMDGTTGETGGGLFAPNFAYDTSSQQPLFSADLLSELIPEADL